MTGATVANVPPEAEYEARSLSRVVAQCPEMDAQPALVHRRGIVAQPVRIKQFVRLTL